MSSQLNVDTIVDKAGSGGTNVKIGNTSTYVSDGGSATQNTVQALAKTWIQFNGTGTIATQDSFGVGSLTDNNTGNYSIGFANNMANNDYANAGIGNTAGMSSEAVTTSALNALTFNSSGSNNDVTIVSAIIHGDLA